jgi:hypothetical protein
VADVQPQLLVKERVMNAERALRLIGGAFVFASVLLGRFVHSNFYWFAAFVGLNLFQSAFTNWCPMMAVLRKAGLTDRPEWSRTEGV